MVKKILVVTLIGTCLLQQPSLVFAHGGYGHGDYRYGGYRYGGYRYGGYGYRGSNALAITSLAVSAAALIYSSGMFYRYTPTGYVVAAPPIGAVVPALPPGYTVSYFNGAPYYYYGNVYYAAAPNGYVVSSVAPQAPVVVAPAVQQPVVAQMPAAQPSSATGGSDVFEIYIPNGNGSFTTVKLQKTDKGFLGPQGEFYADHPTVDELKQRYVK